MLKLAFDSGSRSEVTTPQTMNAKKELMTDTPKDGAKEVPNKEGEPSELRMDSGLTAWLQVLGSWILFMNTWYVPSYHI